MAKRNSKARQSSRPDYPMPVTSAREVVSMPAQAVPVANGPTVGYRDADDGKVERRRFEDGRLPVGWHDNPAKCENCDGIEHPEYVT
jgi:hypothetical protein